MHRKVCTTKIRGTHRGRVAFRLSDSDADQTFQEMLQSGATRGKAASPERWGYEPEPGKLYVAVRAISSRVNANYDGWPPEELEANYKTFIGKPVYVEHHNWDTKRARGVIIDTKLHRDRIGSRPDYWVELLEEVDAEAFPRLAKAIINGDIDSVSMGCDVTHTRCSACGNVARDVHENCEHIPHMKGQKVQVKDASGQREALVWEDCYGPSFFEISHVFDPADESAFVSDFYMAGVSDTKAASRKVASTGTSRQAAGEDVISVPEFQVEPDDELATDNETPDPEPIPLQELVDVPEPEPEPEPAPEPEPEPAVEEAPTTEEPDLAAPPMEDFGPPVMQGPSDGPSEEAPSAPAPTPEAPQDPNQLPDVSAVEREFGVDVPAENVAYYLENRPSRPRGGSLRATEGDAMQTEEKKGRARARAIAAARARQAAATERTGTETDKKDDDEAARRRARRQAAARRAAARAKAAAKKAKEEKAKTPDREALRTAARERFLSNKAQAAKEAKVDTTDAKEAEPKKVDVAKLAEAAKQRKADTAPSDDQVRNEPDTEDVESVGASAPTNEQERNVPDTTDVEKQEFDPAKEVKDQTGDKMQVQDSGQPDSFVQKEAPDPITPWSQSSKSARLIQVFSFVEDREAAGLSSKDNRLAEIARFEKMNPEKFEGYVEALDEFKAASARTASRAPRRVASAGGDLQRVPGLGRPAPRQAAASTDNDDSLSDSLAFL